MILVFVAFNLWIPACAGMTKNKVLRLRDGQRTRNSALAAPLPVTTVTQSRRKPTGLRDSYGIDAYRRCHLHAVAQKAYRLARQLRYRAFHAGLTAPVPYLIRVVRHRGPES